jgi:hypothetical protein
MNNYTVAFFLVDQSYGGPEEGGWYYSCGVPSDELARFTRGFRDETKALEYALKLNRRVAPLVNRGRPSISSVLSQGRYYAEVCDGLPKPYPEHTPRYE